MGTGDEKMRGRMSSVVWVAVGTVDVAGRGDGCWRARGCEGGQCMASFWVRGSEVDGAKDAAVKRDHMRGLRGGDGVLVATDNSMNCVSGGSKCESKRV
jgi:hypothetical protein